VPALKIIANAFSYTCFAAAAFVHRQPPQLLPETLQQLLCRIFARKI
jgi:hypothetical protein